MTSRVRPARSCTDLPLDPRAIGGAVITGASTQATTSATARAIPAAGRISERQHDRAGRRPAPPRPAAAARAGRRRRRRRRRRRCGPTGHRAATAAARRGRCTARWATSRSRIPPSTRNAASWEINRSEVAQHAAADAEGPHRHHRDHQVEHRRLLGGPGDQPGRRRHQRDRTARGQAADDRGADQPAPDPAGLPPQPDAAVAAPCLALARRPVARTGSSTAESAAPTRSAVTMGSPPSVARAGSVASAGRAVGPACPAGRSGRPAPAGPADG